MNFIFWNCRGTGVRSFPGLIKDLSFRFSVDFVALMETHLHGANASRIIGSNSWLLTVVYGSPNPCLRRDLWRDINNIGETVQEPWCVVGDFNAFHFQEEKFRDSANGSRLDSFFLDMTERNFLIDLGFLVRDSLGIEKSREQWIIHGDRNTRFFHTCTTIRRNHNKIKVLKGEENEWIYDDSVLKDMTIGYFSNFYTNDMDRRIPWRLLNAFLDRFCVSSGQKVNNAKTQVFFTKNVNRNRVVELSANLGYNLTNHLAKYLGVPILHQRVNKNTYSYIVERIRGKFSSWRLTRYPLLVASLCDSLNSVAADFVTSLSEWDWSRFGFLLQDGVCDMIVAIFPLLVWVLLIELLGRILRMGHFLVKQTIELLLMKQIPRILVLGSLFGNGRGWKGSDPLCDFVGITVCLPMRLGKGVVLQNAIPVPVARLIRSL
ncbi:putative ribonuclease H protein At1g65750 family [Senna tora]|uniref:Putative ribonuclease H protein At1g65750 family n=1 Tax=Senna tora TaxID=362788 RepID=A0A834T0U2_9FABA|nr:putative ribonuclease H protein At1g65750 family [Senna tora]